MAEFAYNNAKKISTSHTPFELNCGYHPRYFYEEDVNPCSQSKSADNLATGEERGDGLLNTARLDSHEIDSEGLIIPRVATA